MKLKDALKLYDVLSDGVDTYYSIDDILNDIYAYADDPDEALEQEVYAAEGGIHPINPDGYINFNHLMFFVPQTEKS